MSENYKANFLWPHEDGSLEQLGYEFANANTEEYREEVWKEIIARLSPDVPNDTKKTAMVQLDSIKSSDGWSSLAYELKFNKFEEEHKHLNEDEIADKFYEEVICKSFKYGDFANLEIEFDEDFNIVGGKIRTQ